MRTLLKEVLTVLFASSHIICFSQTYSFTATNPNNSNASVSLSWLNDIPRIRYGGNGPGSSYGFQIQGPGDQSRFVVLNSGNVGIGTTSPGDKLEVKTSVKINDPSNRGNAILKLDRGTEARDRALIQFGEANNYYWNLGLLYQGGSANSNFYISRYDRITDPDGTFVHTPELMINSLGNIGVGSLNPGAKLTVKGDIHAEEVRVDLTVPGPDYVFEEDYDLPSLKSLQNYIRENKHLPEVPSAQAMEKNGIDLGVMNMLLLKKVEELTLYTLEQEANINKLKKEKIILKKSTEGEIEKLLSRQVKLMEKLEEQNQRILKLENDRSW